MSVLDVGQRETEPETGTLAECLEAAGFEGVDIASDERYGGRRKVIVWVDR